MVEKTDKILFRETQQFRQKWLWLLLLLVGLAIVGPLILRSVEQSNSGSLGSGFSIGGVLGALLAVGLIYLFYAMKLITEVREDGVYVRFSPLTRQQKIEFEEIQSCDVRVYRPILEYGGWGIRYGRNGKAYNVSGNQGVQLELAQGKPLLIGSQRADELAESINSKR